MMERSFFLLVILILKVFQASLCVHGREHESLSFIRCKKYEQQALLKFKHSFTEDPTNLLSSWVGEECCQWHGVTCDNVTHHVIKLNLRTQPLNFYSDCLPDPQVSMVSSGVSSALLELKLLTHLDLSGNDFSGSQIPQFIGSMRHLRYLTLSSAGFSGPFPPQLGNLTNLVHLDLHLSYDCYEQSSLYSEGLGWASGLLKLQSLDMGSCDLSRAHDTFKVLKTLPSLSSLSLSDCQLHNSHLSQALIGNTSNLFFPTLQHFDLSSNAFEGPLPSFFKNMVSLRSLNLAQNTFNWSVPLWLRSIQKLELLDLSSNNFIYLEGGLVGILGNPCNIKHLDLSVNYISQGDILDSLSSFGCNAFELQYLDLSSNSMKGSLPSSLRQLKNLNYLALSHNNMSGSLPSSFGKLTNLSYLDLSYNEFTGRVPTSFVKFSAFKYLDLSYNQLSGLIPDFIGNLTQIEHLDISSNSLQGTVLGIGNLSKLSYLDMNYNNLNLDFNPSFNWQPSFQLQVFRVHSCVINTVFPQWLENQTQIEHLDLSYTGISGELPGWLWYTSNLKQIHLSGNRLTGSLPQDTHYGPYIYKLQWLDLHSNLLTGTIPKWLGYLVSIQVIDLSSNLLTGPIFIEENGLSPIGAEGSVLWVLDLSDNMLSGEIHFGNVDLYAYLQILSLQGNHFNGTIPSQLCDFKSLLVLQLAHNRLTGHIPSCLGSISFTKSYNSAASKNLQIEEIIKGIVEESTGTSGGQSIVDLSNNYLDGTIPEELANNSALFALNLSYNHLTGHIPENIGSLKSIESLDLSNNRLSGTIPQSLSFISWLSKLNLSNNHLHGPIPTGRQLQTLDDPSIYAGNSGLCGFPLPNDCTKPAPPSPSLTNVNTTAGKDDVEKKDKKYYELWFILAIMSSVATGFWGVVGTLVIKRSWRHAYFRYVENLGDRIYVPVKVRVNRLKRRFNENL